MSRIVGDRSIYTRLSINVSHLKPNHKSYYIIISHAFWVMSCDPAMGKQLPTASRLATATMFDHVSVLAGLGDSRSLASDSECVFMYY